MPGVQLVTVTAEEHGQKLLQFLQRRLGSDVPKSLLMRLIRKGQVRVDKGRKKPFDRVNAGQEVRIPPIRLDDAPTPPTLPPLDIIAEGPGWIAVRKPHGLPAQPGTGHQDAASERLRAMFADAPFTPTPAHRLDKDTSGLLLAGSTYEGLTALQDAFKHHTLRKYYLARVHGTLPPGESLTLRDAMEKAGQPGHERMHTGTGKNALAYAKCLESDNTTSLLEIDLRTGRTHQIRVQLATRNLPIIGDRKYGIPDNAPRMMLHAWKIALPNGTTIEDTPDW